MPPSAPEWKHRQGSGLSPTCNNPAIFGSSVHTRTRTEEENRQAFTGKHRREYKTPLVMLLPSHSRGGTGGGRERQREAGREREGGIEREGGREKLGGESRWR